MDGQSVPSGIPVVGGQHLLFYVYATNVGCPPGSESCKLGLIWQESNSLTGLQRSRTITQTGLRSPDTDLL